MNAFDDLVRQYLDECQRFRRLGHSTAAPWFPGFDEAERPDDALQAKLDALAVLAPALAASVAPEVTELRRAKHAVEEELTAARTELSVAVDFGRWCAERAREEALRRRDTEAEVTNLKGGIIEARAMLEEGKATKAAVLGQLVDAMRGESE